MSLISQKEQRLTVAAISKKRDGSMRFSGGKKARKNRGDFLAGLSINPEQVVGAELVHGNNVEVVERHDAGKVMPKTDALLTSEKGIYLALTVADCLPVFLFEPDRELVGLVHCGWQGLAQDILSKTCGKIRENWGDNLDNLLVYIGPGICGDCYLISKKRAESFSSYPQALKYQVGGALLDLRKVAKKQLCASGAKERNIKVSSECTYELEDKYFSYRREGNPIKTMLAVFGKKGE